MSSPRIMIVDDEPDIVRALSLRLRAAGYEICSAGDGLAATQMAIAKQPDLIILDIGLPGGDGHTVASRLRENSTTMSIPVIYLTARNTQQDMNRANELDAAGYVMKPFKAERLLELVDSVLSGTVSVRN